MSSLARARRAYHFVRHMPPRKLAARVMLTVKRRLRDRIGSPFHKQPETMALRPDRPLPLFPARPPFCIRAADGSLSFTFLNRTVAMPGPGIDWSAPGPGAADQLWRMNLHYMEFIEAFDRPSAERAVADWIAGNPQGRPGAWRDAWNSYALSLRVVVWMQASALRGDLPASVVAGIEASLAEQMTFLERNLETDLGGNHLIKNIKALIWAGAAFVGPAAGRWRARGLALLEAELPRQVLADGMHDERSPSYHGQVFADLLECRHALGEDPLGGRLDKTLAAMAQVVADLAHPDGCVAQFNDAGLGMAYAPEACLSAYARLFGSRPEPRRVFAYRSAGYAGFREDDAYFVADCGRIAPDDLPAHGHGDVLSFEWSLAGRRLVVDQGVFEYVAGARRQASRTASHHNTLCLDGADQADFFGAFRCGRRPNVVLREVTDTTDGIALAGSHYGFCALPGSPVHLRRFAVTPRRLTIRDTIQGRTTRGGSLGFLLAPGTDVALAADGAVLRHAGCEVRVTVAGGRLGVEDAVWWPDMGREERTLRLRVRLEPGFVGCTTTFSVT